MLFPVRKVPKFNDLPVDTLTSGQYSFYCPVKSRLVNSNFRCNSQIQGQGNSATGACLIPYKEMATSPTYPNNKSTHFKIGHWWQSYKKNSLRNYIFRKKWCAPVMPPVSWSVNRARNHFFLQGASQLVTNPKIMVAILIIIFWSFCGTLATSELQFWALVRQA